MNMLKKKKYTFGEQLEQLQKKGKLYRTIADNRLTRLEEVVFHYAFPFEPEKRTDPVTLMARLERLEAAMTWWKRT